MSNSNNSLEVICLDNSNRPNEIPISRWLIKDNPYTIIKLVKMNQQNGIYGVKLAELNNDDLYPWTYFRLDRFGLSLEFLLNKVKEEELELEEVY
jgi:hypothetical protein